MSRGLDGSSLMRSVQNAAMRALAYGLVGYRRSAAVSTGRVGDDKIFGLGVAGAVHVHTGQRGESSRRRAL